MEKGEVIIPEDDVVLSKEKKDKNKNKKNKKNDQNNSNDVLWSFGFLVLFFCILILIGLVIYYRQQALKLPINMEALEPMSAGLNPTGPSASDISKLDTLWGSSM